MAVDWGDYVVCDSGVAASAETVPRTAERIALLVALAARNGVSLDGVGALDALDRWFRGEVREDSACPGRLDPAWASVVGDIALYVGGLAAVPSPRQRPASSTALDVTEYGLRILAGADAEHGHLARILQGMDDHAAGRT